MKIPLRIVAPILFALLCAGVLMGFLWWQLNLSTGTLLTAKEKGNSTHEQLQNIVEPARTEVSAGSEDRALVHLRQGDLFALKGAWKEAQKEYEESVRSGGDLPALRKLAQAQLQRRDIVGVQKTIKDMKVAGAKSEDLLLLESIVSLRTGELVQARTMLEESEDSPQKQYGLALLSIIEGAHQSAQAALQNVVNGWEPVLRSHAKIILAAYEEFALFPESPDIHLITLLSRALAQVQECELALPLLTQVTAKKDDYRDAWIVQGYCELITERTEQSLASLEQAYNIDPQKSETQYFLGRAYADLGDSANAITFFEYAVVNGFKPEAEVRQYIAQEALKIGNGELAMQQYTYLMEIEGADFSVFEQFILTSLTLQQVDKAELASTEAVKRWPEKGKAHYLFGKAALENKKRAEAAQAFRRAVELDPFLQEAKEALENL